MLLFGWDGDYSQESVNGVLYVQQDNAEKLDQLNKLAIKLSNRQSKRDRRMIKIFKLLEVVWGQNKETELMPCSAPIG